VYEDFNKSRKDQTPLSWELYRKAQWVYRREVRKASKETWRVFCTSINELPKTARIHGALSKDSKVRLDSLVAPLSGHMQSEGHTLDLFLHTHFPDSGAVEVTSGFTSRTT
jgi:hypothetical protein